MHPLDPDAGQFSALLADLAELQAQRRDRTMAKALPLPRQQQRGPREAVPFSYFSKAARAAMPGMLPAAFEALTGELAKTNTMLLASPAASVGERRTRLRASVQDVLDRAMKGLARGELTAIEVAKLEARGNRLLASVEPGIAMQRGVE